MDQDKSNNNIIISKQGHIGRLTLNRPKALNALNLDMIREMRFALEQWLEDDKIRAVYIDGNGDRAFCAGGDIKQFYRAGMSYRRGDISFETATLFFKEEYSLNEFIFHYKKPIISHMHGITMGGGFGIAGNAKYRVVAPDTVFAMPEVKIGFVPDVGSMYHLTKVEGNIGLYLSISGNTILAGDMLHLGLAEYSLGKEKSGELVSALNKSFETSTDQSDELLVQETLDNRNSKTDLLSALSDDIKQSIESCFSQNSIGEALKCLGDSKVIKDEYDKMHGNSPYAMTFAFEYYQFAKDKEFSDIIAQDFKICSHFAMGQDFYEGIRAMVVDKDKKSRWQGFDISLDTNIKKIRELLV